MAKPSCFAFVACFGPIVGAGEEVFRAQNLPVKIASSVHLHHRPADVDRVIGAKTEFAAGFEFRRDPVKRAGVHHPPFGVARLAPRIGVEEVDTLKRRIGQPREHIKRVTHVQPDIAQPATFDMDKRTDDAIEKRFAADKAVIGASGGLGREMFSCAKADFELKRTIITEQYICRQRPISHRNLRQQIFYKRRLPLTQFMAAASPVKAVDCCRIVHRLARDRNARTFGKTVDSSGMNPV